MIFLKNAEVGWLNYIGRRSVKWIGRGWSIWSAYPIVASQRFHHCCV